MASLGKEKSDQPRLFQIMYEKRVDESVLSDGLHHVRPLVTQQSHHSRYAHLLKYKQELKIDENRITKLRSLKGKMKEEDPG